MTDIFHWFVDFLSTVALYYLYIFVFLYIFDFVFVFVVVFDYVFSMEQRNEHQLKQIYLYV